MKAKLLFQRRNVYELKRSGKVVVIKDLWEVPKARKGLFLNRYKLSWIAFDYDHPEIRLLMDAHPPHGLHIHFNDSERQKLDFKSVDDANDFFDEQVLKYFGEIKETI